MHAGLRVRHLHVLLLLLLAGDRCAVVGKLGLVLVRCRVQLSGCVVALLRAILGSTVLGATTKRCIRFVELLFVQAGNVGVTN